tara:strand:- start:798 stop:1133 length:336 start_codon:yes stop_codon:yes gene_type:complete
LRGRIGPFVGYWPRFPHAWAHLCHQPSPGQVDIGQGKRRGCACGVLGQAPVAHFAEAPEPLDHIEHVFDPRPDSRFVAALGAGNLIDNSVVADALIREAPGMGTLAWISFF